MLEFLMQPETFAVFSLLSIANALFFLTRAWLRQRTKGEPLGNGHLTFTYINLLVFAGYVFSMGFVKHFILA